MQQRDRELKQERQRIEDEIKANRPELYAAVGLKKRLVKQGGVEEVGA